MSSKKSSVPSLLKTHPFRFTKTSVRNLKSHNFVNVSSANKLDAMSLRYEDHAYILHNDEGYFELTNIHTGEALTLEMFANEADWVGHQLDSSLPQYTKFNIKRVLSLIEQTEKKFAEGKVPIWKDLDATLQESVLSSPIIPSEEEISIEEPDEEEVEPQPVIVVEPEVEKELVTETWADDIDEEPITEEIIPAESSTPDTTEKYIQQLDSYTDKDSDGISITEEVQQYINNRIDILSEQLNRQSRMTIAAVGGGGTVAKQYVEGGTMGGNLHVQGHVIHPEAYSSPDAISIINQAALQVDQFSTGSESIAQFFGDSTLVFDIARDGNTTIYENLSVVKDLYVTGSLIVAGSTTGGGGGTGPDSTGSGAFITNITCGGISSVHTDISEVTVNAIGPILSATVDNTDVRFWVQWEGTSEEWTGTPSVNGINIPRGNTTSIGGGFSRRFEGYVDIDMAASAGQTVTVPYTYNSISNNISLQLAGGGPVVQDVQIISTPGHGQDHYKTGDDITFIAVFDTPDVVSFSLVGDVSTATEEVIDAALTIMTGVSATITARCETSFTFMTSLPIEISGNNTLGTRGPIHASSATAPTLHGPVITNVSFGTFPGTQTELKEGDDITVNVSFDTSNISSVSMQGGTSYATTTDTYNITTGGSSSIDIPNVTVSTSTTTALDLPVRLRAVGGANNDSVWVTSGNTLKVNNAGPIFSGFSVTYPGGKSALEGTDTADVSLTITSTGGAPEYMYFSPLNDIDIADSTVYTPIKTVTCTNPGTYNTSTPNFSVVATRSENDHTSTYSGIVNIADTLPNLDVGTPGIMRSGGNNNTSVQVHQITVTSSQSLASFTMNSAGTAGTFTGSWVSSNNNKTWTRNLQVSDMDQKGTFAWTSITVENLAGQTLSAIQNASSNYILGGFVSRSVTVPALSRTCDIGTSVSDPTKLTVSETFRGSIVFDNTIPDGTVLDDNINTGINITGKFTIVNNTAPSIVDLSGNMIFYLDRVAVNVNSSGTSTMSMEESV